MANDRVILELVLAGRSYSEIVAVAGCSRRNHARCAVVHGGIQPLAAATEPRGVAMEEHAWRRLEATGRRPLRSPDPRVAVR